MKNSLETKLGIFVAVTILAAILVVETLGNFNWMRGGYHINALFNSAQDLKEGNAVKMAGVEIGHVEKIELANDSQKVKVTMKLNSDTIVKTDSKATIRFTGLMGQNFVNVTFGGTDSPRASEGTTLQTEEQPDLNAVMAKLDEAAAGIKRFGDTFTGIKIDNLVGPLIDFVKQNGPHIGGAVSNIENITAQISSGQGTVGKIIYDQTLYNSAMDTVSNLQDTVAGARGLITGITNGQGTLGKLATDDTLYNSTAASMTNLQQILMKINQGQGTVGKLVNDQEFYKNAKLSLQKLDKMADSLEDEGPLSVVGTIAQNLF